MPQPQRESGQTLEHADDKRLLARVAQADTDAMRALYERHHDAMFAFIRSRGADKDLAADVLHDAMLAIWNSAARYRDSSSVRTWMFTIARNKYVDHVRGGARLSLVEEIPDSIDDAPDAETVIDEAQNAARVRHCLDDLNDQQRSVVRLAFFDGLTYDEVAEVEGVPTGTIKSRIFHAKKALMRCLSRCLP